MRPSTIKHVKSAGAKAIPKTPNPLFRVTAHAGYRPSPSQQGYIMDKYCVRHEIAKEALDSKPRQGLWWNVISNHMQLKATMRSWCRKRMTKAVVEALHTYGFDDGGMPLPAKEGALCPQRTRGLEGTLVVFCQEALLTASAEERRMAGELVVRQAMQRAGLE